MAGGLVFVGYNLYKNSGLGSISEAASPVVSSNNDFVPSVAPYQWSKTPEAVPVAGCIAMPSKSKCQCFSAAGTTLELSHGACLSVIGSPLPRSFRASERDR